VRLVLISIIGILLHCIFFYKVIFSFDGNILENIFKTVSDRQSIFKGFPLNGIWFITEIVFSVLLGLLLVLSIITMMRIKNKEYEKVKKPLNIGKIFILIFNGIFILGFAAVTFLFVMLCLMTIGLAVPKLWRGFSAFFYIFNFIIPESVAMIAWFIESVCIANTIKRIKFYSAYL
jgi:hypothetical protein